MYSDLFNSLVPMDVNISFAGHIGHTEMRGLSLIFDGKWEAPNFEAHCGF